MRSNYLLRSSSKFLFTGLLSIGVIFSSFAQSSTETIKGLVKTSDEKPAEFVNVGLRGTTKGATTNSKGEFEINKVEPGTYTLILSFVGMETKEQQVEVKSGEVTTLPVIFLKENSQQLQEVMVTATRTINEKPVNIGKMKIKPMDLPQSVSYIDKEILDQQQALRASDAIKNFNGVYIMGTSGGYQEEIAGRGFAFGSSNTFKNGVRFNNTAMPEMSSLEKMEVMKGSTAILFGNVAAGGILNLITKKPQFEKGGEVSFRTGSYDLYKPSIDIFGPLGSNKIAAFRFNTSYEKAGSFRDNVKSERVYFNPSFLFKLGKKTDILIEGDYLNDDRTADFGVGAIDYTLIDIPRTRFIGVAWSYFKTEQQSGTATITHRFNDNWEIKNVTAYQKFKSELFANQRPNGNSQFIKPDGTWIRGLQRTKIDEDYYLSQIDLTGKFSTGFIKHNFLLGVDGDKYLTDNLSYNPLSKYDTVNVFEPGKYKARNDIPELTARTLTTTPIKRAGAYIQDLISITSYLKVLAGARISYLETFSDAYTYSTKTTVKTRQFDHAITPRFGIVVQPLPTTSIFGSYSNSFTPNTGVDVNGKALPPSFIDQYEAGVKNDFFKGLLSANITVYQIVNSNLAQTSLANGNTNTSIKELAGEVTSKGLELDLVTKPWNGLSFIGGYSLNETKYTKTNTYIVGSLLRYNPNHTANLSAYYTFEKFKPLTGLNFGISALYIGERQAGRSTRVAIINDSNKLIPLSAYTQLDASIGYTKNNISVRIKVSNISDELNYNVHDDNSVNPISPRLFGGTVSYKF